MKFCPKCGGLIVPKKEGDKVIWVCNSCGERFEDGGDITRVSQKINHKNNDIVVVKDNRETLPITDKECPKCGHSKAYWWTQQTRSSDEPETRFYKCEKCGHTWREYS